MAKREKETDTTETVSMATSQDPDEPEHEKGAARFSVVLPAGVARSVRRAAAEENMLVSEFIRAVLRGDVKPPELGD